MYNDNTMYISEKFNDKILFVKDSEFGINSLLNTVSGEYIYLYENTLRIRNLKTSTVIKLTVFFENTINVIVTKSKIKYLVVKNSDINKIWIIFSKNLPKVNGKIEGYLLYKTYFNDYVLKTDFKSDEYVKRQKIFSEKICVCILQNDKICIVIKENI